ncbi:hypothetical protein MYAM1_003517 [Malassezia yamatoensis]|uniref:Succinate dehydrogenase assembly factor 4, mitochondrial n=1 Tax=Malassezia yamatoensis TaxID=253288 RepID=A0AAJ5Z1U7_9BASI|nr:hypothetical protein MYAM1_003517 [Malassezia yamatoensis]
MIYYRFVGYRVPAWIGEKTQGAMRTPCTNARMLSYTLARRSDSDNRSLFERRGPPPLPKEQQKEFERLIRENRDKTSFVGEDKDGNPINMHPDAIRGAGKDFDGDVNPETGEIGGPKKDPLRYNEWTYGGRATDF